MFDIVRYYAVFYDANGVYIGKKRLDRKLSTFSFLRRSFVFDPLNSSYFKIWNPFWATKFYSYNLDNPEPLTNKLNYQPFMTASQFNILIETNALQKLNDLAKKNWLLEFLTLPNIIVAVVVAVGIWYLMNKGSFI